MYLSILGCFPYLCNESRVEELTISKNEYLDPLSLTLKDMYNTSDTTTEIHDRLPTYLSIQTASLAMEC